MKELLEEYVVEAQNLRQQVALLLRVMGAVLDDEYEVTLRELEDTTPAGVRVEDGIVYVTA